MAWPNDCIRLLRSLIGDDDLDNLTYSDNRLKPLITSSALFVVMEQDFSQDYKINISEDSISPDPRDKGQNGRFFQILTALRAAMTIAENDYRIASNKAVAFRDGPSSIDLRDTAEAKRRLLEHVKERYSAACIAYRTGDGVVGEGIVSPYNLGLGSGEDDTTTMDSTYSHRGRFS